MVLTKRDSVLNSHTHLFAAIVVGSNEASSEEASQLPQKRYQLPNICHNGGRGKCFARPGANAANIRINIEWNYIASCAKYCGEVRGVLHDGVIPENEK